MFFNSYSSYIIVFVLILFVFFFGYIKVYHRFWYLQPVFHFYKFWNFVLYAKIIEDKPIESPYRNHENIVTTKFENISQHVLEETIWLLQRNFLRNRNNEYIPDLSLNFLPFFTDKSFLSVYYNQRILKETKTSICKKDNSQIIGVMTSIPIQMILFTDKYIIHYVDFLCVHRNFRKMSIAEQLIQTHEYNQRIIEPTIKISLFKREGTLNFIVPLCVYKTYFRKLQKSNKNNNTSTNFTVEILILRDIIDFINLHHKKFQCFLQFPWTSISKLIETNNIFFVAVLDPYLASTDPKNIHALYVFKDSCTTYNNTKTKMLVCIGSIFLPDLSLKDFQSGFVKATDIINKENNNVFSAVIIETVSHNYHLLVDDDVFFTNMAYFFYNFTQTTLPPSQFLFIG